MGEDVRGEIKLIRIVNLVKKLYDLVCRRLSWIFFFQNNQIPQTISLVSKVSKLFSNLTNRVFWTWFCSLKSNKDEWSFIEIECFTLEFHEETRQRNPDEELEEGETQQRRNTNYTKKVKPSKEETQTHKEETQHNSNLESFVAT